MSARFSFSMTFTSWLAVLKDDSSDVVRRKVGDIARVVKGRSVSKPHQFLRSKLRCSNPSNLNVRFHLRYSAMGLSTRPEQDLNFVADNPIAKKHYPEAYAKLLS